MKLNGHPPVATLLSSVYIFNCWGARLDTGMPGAILYINLVIIIIIITRHGAHTTKYNYHGATY